MLRKRFGRTTIFSVAAIATAAILTIGVREALADDARSLVGCTDACDIGGPTQCAQCCILLSGDYTGGQCTVPSNICVCTT